MDGKEFFKEQCKQKGIDYKVYFQLGAQNPRNPDRLSYRCSPHVRKETQRFAVCYFKAENLYVAWNLRADPIAAKMTVFSVKKDDVYILDESKVLTTKKIREYPGRGEERLYAFTPDTIESFLEMVCGDVICSLIGKTTT